MRKTHVVMAMIFLFLGTAGICVLDAQAPSSPPPLKPQSGSRDVGLLFNVPSILLELQSYQGGLGLKIGSGPWAFRAGADVMYNSAANSSNVSGTFAIEYHFLTGPISPYVGAVVGAGWTYQQDVMSDIPLSAGGIAGVEIFVFDFLSVYAEYAISGTLSLTQDLQTNSWSKSFLVDSGLGNSGTLGIVVYFTRQGHEKK